jgi:hypothetical protein
MVYRTHAANGETRVSRHRSRWVGLGGVAEEPVTVDQLTKDELKQLDREVEDERQAEVMAIEAAPEAKVMVDLTIKHATTEQLIEVLAVISPPQQPVDPNSENAALEMVILTELIERQQEAAQRSASVAERR